MIEIEGHAGHGESGGNPLIIPVSITISILAVLIAAVTLLGHRSHTEELLRQAQASDQWAFYQAKNTRQRELQNFADVLAVVTTQDSEKAGKIRESYAQEAERYTHEKEEISEKAREFEKERDFFQKRANYFDAGEGTLEFALVICSLTLLTNKKFFWLTGILIGIIGVLVALGGFLVRA